MNKKKQSPIAKNLDAIIKEANLHSEKKLKRSNLGRFTGSFTPLDITPSTKKEAVPKSNNNINKSSNEQKRNDKSIANSAEIKQKKAASSTKNKETNSNKKQRKRIWQKDSCAPQNSYVSIIDKRVDIKKLRGKSMLCIGGVRSGKSDFALTWANMFEGKKAFIATMQTPKEFEAQQNAPKRNSPNQKTTGKNSIDKNNKLKITPHTQQSSGKNEDNNERDNYDISPRYFQSDRVKDMYRIHTHLKDESPHFSYHSHVSSKFIESEVEGIQDKYPQEEYTSSGYEIDEHKHKTHNTKKQNTEKNSSCKEEKDHAFISDFIKDTKNKNPHDPIELESRISKHRAQRDKSWITIEEPSDMISAMRKAKEEKCSVAVIDCLTLWLTNLILQEKTDKQILNKVEELADLLKKPPIPLVIVTNEVGAGIVPDNALARRFRDLQGKANQILAKDSSTVVMSFCGLPLLLKG